MDQPERHKSLFSQANDFSEPDFQLQLLERTDFPLFAEKLRESDLFPLRPQKLEIMQVNLGKMCNQVCRHCHVDAGPDRREIMTRETMEQCLNVIDASDCTTVDLTGGAPEMNPEFRWFVSEITRRNKHVIVRCNLTIILSNKKFNDLPEFFKTHGVEVVSSLPYFTAMKTDAQRGDGVFNKSIEALKLLNGVGFGKEGTGLMLNLVYNPSGAFLPANQAEMENQFKKRLYDGYGIEFNQLFTITNLPVSRFLEYLVASGNYESYMEKLVDAYNPAAASNVMCRNTISVGWDGKLYDCDFNQMLDLKVDSCADTLQKFDLDQLADRSIIVNQHCYGCTAGSGSSCGGTTTI